MIAVGISDSLASKERLNVGSGSCSIVTLRSGEETNIKRSSGASDDSGPDVRRCSTGTYTKNTGAPLASNTGTGITGTKTRVGLRVWGISVTDRRCDSTLTEFVFGFKEEMLEVGIFSGNKWTYQIRKRLCMERSSP